MNTIMGRRFVLVLVMTIGGLNWPGTLLQAAVVAPKPTVPTPESTQPNQPRSPQPQTACPTDIQSLTNLLIRDLPSYANRKIRSASRLNSPVGNSSVIIAGRPEFEPLPLDHRNLAPIESDPQQVFITTLERHYLDNSASELQHYHWIFLTRSTSGWRLATMFSRVGISKSAQPPTPPRESSDGAIGQAIKVWLKDCRAGVIRR